MYPPNTRHRRHPLRSAAALFGALLAFALPGLRAAEPDAPSAHGAEQPCFSGIYPHLAMFNHGGECGIGALVPWAGKLWVITYPPHATKGSPDQLHVIGPQLAMSERPESVGGTHACRLIHRESQQLFIGPYAIDAQGQVRVIDLSKLVGRMTAVARHLTDPANKVYYYDMEGALYEVDVHSLAVTRLFEKPVPGWHGKGAYSGQGRLVIANNGEEAVGKKSITSLAPLPPRSDEDAGVLAEWDGKDWRIVERRQFTDVTGPGGIEGAPDERSPLWSIGWDRRSVMLKLLDGGVWSTYRLPKASHAFDPRHGWYTEWPRIREIGDGRLLMAMHGMLYEFPKGFSAAHTGGIIAQCSHLRYVTDFCAWQGRLVISADDASVMQNPMAGQSQSNLWFGAWADLRRWGPRSGWGGPWLGDAVKADEWSDPYLVGGFAHHCLHLINGSDQPIAMTLQLDATGDGGWKELERVAVPAHGYVARVFQNGIPAQWLRCASNRDAVATAYLHAGDNAPWPSEPAAFAALAEVGEPALCGGLIRPAGHDRTLQWLPRIADGGTARELGYREIDEHMICLADREDRRAEVERLCAFHTDFHVGENAVIMEQDGKRYLLPKGDAGFDRPGALGPARGIREVCSERFLMNVHGTFYELPRDHGLPLIRPISSHRKQIVDFCSWRGLLVLSGTKPGAPADAHHVPFGEAGGLWFGSVDDLWRLGKPVGHGGPWAKTTVAAGVASDPYLMTGFDRKTLTITHDQPDPVDITIEVDVAHHGWVTYQTLSVPAGAGLVHRFPDGYSAHWVRVVAKRACLATATFVYE